MAYQLLISTTLCLCAVYSLYLIIFRIFFHPLSKFPGPKIAAATFWYEFYFDVVQQGKWVFEIQRLHAEYGPIVRINPDELHIKDSSFFQELYAPAGGGKKRSKYRRWTNLAGTPGSIFATTGHELHRLRRNPLNYFFSKKAIGEVEPLLREKVEKLCSRFLLATEQGKPLRADCAFMALTMDVICTYCFGYDKGYLDSPDFGLAWKRAINTAWESAALNRAFPWLGQVLQHCPLSVARKVDVSIAALLEWRDSIADDVSQILKYRDEERNTRTIFHALRDSDLPAEEKSLQRLVDEGQIFTGAGSETTARTLTLILYYLCTYPDCMQKLKRELVSAIPDPAALPRCSRLEQLPYLSAVLQEGLRLSYGVTTRLPRIADEPMQYKEFTIPPGTPTSETPFFVLTDDSIFPQPHAFKPERWQEAGNRLDRYQVSFGLGSRQCIGINLAYAEMYLTCAAIFRRFEFELFETGFENIEMVHDFFVAAPARGNRAVKVRVLGDG